LTTAPAGSGCWSAIGTPSSPPHSTPWVAAEAIKVLRTPVRAPRANAYAEWWVGRVRREVWDRMLIVGCWQLRSVLANYVDHDNRHRPHRALGQAPPLGPGVPVVVGPSARIVRRDRLGGLIHEYAQVA
jgi:putative transposase